MILLRHILLENSAVLYPGSQHLTRIVDASMLGIIILSAALILMAAPYRRDKRSAVCLQCLLVDVQLLVHYRPAPSPRLAAVRDFIALRFDGALFYPEGLLSLCSRSGSPCRSPAGC